MVVDVSTLAFATGVIAGVICYLNGWGPLPGLRGGNPFHATRGLLTLLGAGVVSLLLDLLLYQTPGSGYFTGYLAGAACGWLGLLVVGVGLYILWRLSMRRGETDSPSGFALACHAILEALSLTRAEDFQTAASHRPPPGPRRAGAGSGDRLRRLYERLKREDPEGYLELARLQTDGAQRALELQRGELERLWQELARAREDPPRAAEEMIRAKERSMQSLREEIAKARRFYRDDQDKLQAVLAEYDLLLANQEQLHAELRTLLRDVEQGALAPEDLLRVVIYQRIVQHEDAGLDLGALSVAEGRILVRQGAVTGAVADAVVSSDDNYLTMQHGTARRIREQGGEEIYAEARERIPLRRGDVAITGPGRLPARRVFHAVVADWDAREGPTEACIREIVRNVLHKARELKYRRLAFPLLGAGAAGFPVLAAFQAMLGQLCVELAQREGSVREVLICLDTHFAEMIDVARILAAADDDLQAGFPPRF